MKKIIFYFIIFVIIAGLFLSGWFIFEILNPTKAESTSVFVIQPGDGVNQISYNLKKQGVIDNSFVFETYAYLKDIEGGFLAGEYSLPSIINIKRLVDILTTGEAVNDWELKVIEGYTIKDIDETLSSLGKFKSGDLILAVKNINQDFLSTYGFLSDKPPAASLEGFLFPDTYRFFNYATLEDVIRKLLNNFDKKLSEELRTEIKNQERSVFEVITMASIIEREVATENDRPIVAGIFWKRLESGMPLQADSTVNYITGKNTPAVSGVDLKIDSPYNTYLYPSLPPGPICNPGLSAIKAAIYPEESEYWFFLTDKNGNVHYAKDFEEHKANKAKYLSD
ncbi:endolytic transglycosylase MltG [Candidatus Kuenenbacteria bacterium]|nr:endolytic transglycosylase MltG [Candidatus Kuenenbacteria bacterium]